MIIFRAQRTSVESDDEWFCVASLEESERERPESSAQGLDVQKPFIIITVIYFFYYYFNNNQRCAYVHTQSCAIKLLTGQIKTNKARA